MAADIGHKRHSAYAIMSAYAPPDDCVGSEAARLPNGTCKFGKNCTECYAKRVAKGLTSDINSDLKLFDKSGKATEALIVFMSNMAGYELAGKKVIEATIKKAFVLKMILANCNVYRGPTVQIVIGHRSAEAFQPIS